ncbi:hypothetical protein QYF36_024380 [Acer negundo]|nr:hypothetical protein QYF36_024380 [Acer negundo]
MNQECYMMVFFAVPWSFISIMKPCGILLSRVVENKSFSKNISLREITYHDQISNLPNILVLPPSFPFGRMENPWMVFLMPIVIKGVASGRGRIEKTGTKAGPATTTTLKVLDLATIMIPMKIRNHRENGTIDTQHNRFKFLNLSSKSFLILITNKGTTSAHSLAWRVDKSSFGYRTTQSECHENVMLKQEHNRISGENKMLKEAMRNPLCTTCGSSEAMTSGGSGWFDFGIEQLRLENAQMKDEFNIICMLASRLLGFVLYM